MTATSAFAAPSAFCGKTTKGVILDVFAEDFYFHDCFWGVFASAGFGVRSVEKHWYHDFFEVRLWRGTAELDKNDARAAQQVRRLLKQFGFAVESKTIQVIQRRDTVRVFFVFPYGAVGWRVGP